MSTTNAPQPDAAGPAEQFDSTIAPPTGNVSNIGIHVPTSPEGAIHTGSANGIDPYFYNQYMALSSFVWSVADEPAKCLYSIAIHPSEIHQWMAHLCKMYNAWSGGFNMALKIAGTGFHAGALMIARIPPNINPKSLTTVAAVTAFEYTVFDPKMLEIGIKSVMDQRPIMYHYMPLDLNDRNSFGGYLAFYVMLPLATSSTGATEISCQVLSQPAQDFRFFQIRPINLEVVPVAVPSDLEDALDFTNPKTSALYLESIDSIVINPPSTMRFLDKETINCIQFSQDPMNGYFLPRLGVFTRFDETDLNNYSYGLKWSKNSSTDDSFNLGSDNAAPIIAFGRLKFTGSNVYLPKVNGKGAMLFTIGFKSGIRVELVFTGDFSDVNETTDPNLKGYTTKFTISNYPNTLGHWFHIATQEVPEGMADGQSFLANKEFLAFDGMRFNPGTTFGFDLTKYAPPIEESFITFETFSSVSAQPGELSFALNKSAYSGFMDKNSVLIFELVDTKVDLPILPVKLHYSGYMTTYAHEKLVKFPVRDPLRYKFQYVSKGRATTPLHSSVKPIVHYVQNTALSRMIK